MIYYYAFASAVIAVLIVRWWTVRKISKALDEMGWEDD